MGLGRTALGQTTQLPIPSPALINNSRLAHSEDAIATEITACGRSETPSADSGTGQAGSSALF